MDHDSSAPAWINCGRNARCTAMWQQRGVDPIIHSSVSPIVYRAGSEAALSGTTGRETAAACEQPPSVLPAFSGRLIE